jgi:hypothetical protein
VRHDGFVDAVGEDQLDKRLMRRREQSVTDGPREPTADTTDSMLTIYMAKYGTLRDEVFQRFQFQGQAYNFLIVVLTALLAVGAAQFEAGRADVVNKLSLFIPLITGPFAFLYLAHDLMIFSILAYLRRDLSLDISRLLGRDVELSDARFEHLSGMGRFAHRVIAPSRWLLFLFPTLLPIVYAAFFTGLWNEYPFSFLFALDCVVVIMLVAAMAIAAREEASWRRRQGEEIPGDLRHARHSAPDAPN